MKKSGYQLIPAPLINPQLIAYCTYCTMVSEAPEYKTPVSCTKFSGSCWPVLVNFDTCLSCGEYKKSVQGLEPQN